MSYTCARTLSVLTAIVLSTLSSSPATEMPLVRGKLHSPAHEPVQGLVVILEEVSRRADISQADVRLDGSFEVRGIPTGDYTLRVTDGRGLTICEQWVTIQDHMPDLDVRLPEVESGGAGGSGATVSVKQLMHPPKKKAVQAFQRALRLSSAGKDDDGVTQLEEAIRISPEFAEAHTNLAVQHFRLGRYQESAAESALAMQIAGPDPRNLCNLAAAQARLQQFAEAEKSARAAMRLDAGYLKANLILGGILAEQPATRGEGVKHLEKAALEFNSARKFLEQLRESR